MEAKTTFRGKPYRAAPALGQQKWSIYGKDDHGQERYLGTIVQEQDCFYADLAYTDEEPEVEAEGFEAAVEALYALCRSTHFLTQGHPNYLGAHDREWSEEIGAATDSAAIFKSTFQ